MLAGAFCLCMLLAAFLVPAVPASAGEYQSPTPLPIPTVLLEPTSTPAPPPLPPTDTPLPAPAPPTLPPVIPASHTPAPQNTVAPPTFTPAPPTSTPPPHTATATLAPPESTFTYVATSTFAPTYTATRTRTSTATRTSTFSPTVTVTPTTTPSWLPPGPECKPQPGPITLKLPVPYIHQVIDLGQVDGNWACGPTSIAMVLAYFGKLPPWPEYQASQSPGVSATAVPAGALRVSPRITRTTASDTDFVPYVTSVYTYSGHSYSATAADPRGRRVAGLYGTICPSGLADWGRMAQVLEWHGLSSKRISPTWDSVVAALKRGHPVILGNGLTPAGHILVVIGYAPHQQLIVNDPYGNRFSAGYGGTSGEGLFYPWNCSRTRVALEVIGTYVSPTPTSKPSPTGQAAPSSAAARDVAIASLPASPAPISPALALPSTPTASDSSPEVRVDEREELSAEAGPAVAPSESARQSVIEGKSSDASGEGNQPQHWMTVSLLCVVVVAGVLGSERPRRGRTAVRGGSAAGADDAEGDV